MWRLRYVRKVAVSFYHFEPQFQVNMVKTVKLRDKVPQQIFWNNHTYFFLKLAFLSLDVLRNSFGTVLNIKLTQECRVKV